MQFFMVQAIKNSKFLNCVIRHGIICKFNFSKWLIHTLFIFVYFFTVSHFWSCPGSPVLTVSEILTMVVNVSRSNRLHMHCLPLEPASAATINRMRSSELKGFPLLHQMHYLLYTSRSDRHDLYLRYLLTKLKDNKVIDYKRVPSPRGIPVGRS